MRRKSRLHKNRRLAPDGVPVFCSFDQIAPADALILHPRNPNEHPPEQLRLYLKIIRANGWRRAAVVSRRSGFVTKGNGAVAAARLGSLKSIPVDYQDYASDEAEMEDLLADNELARLAHSDDAAVAKILAELQAAGRDPELAGILKQLESPAPDLPDLPDKPAEAQAKWRVAPGQIWACGPHRIICGDSTDPATVQALLGKAAPILLITDPPYGVDYDPEWRVKFDGSKLHALGKVKNDSQVDWTAAYKLAPAQVAYVWHAGRFASEVAANLQSAGYQILSQIIWAKPHFVLSRGDYHWQHEPCWYAAKKGPHHWQGSRKESTLWEIQTRNGFIDEPGEDPTGHATQKPIECMARPIRNNTAQGESVYDPFLGSGTTLIAAEQLGRICYGVELHPPYVALILERYLVATGTKPKLLGPKGGASVPASRGSSRQSKTVPAKA